MSLQDYQVARDHFRADDMAGVRSFAFPCSACVHRGLRDTQQPCRTCDHNVNAVSDEPDQTDGAAKGS
jgi:hypothetical protein